MGKALCFIYNDMADFEMTLPMTAMGQWLQKEVITISYEKEVIRSKPGIQYQPHGTVKEALDFDDVDGIIIPGGWNDEQRDELTQLIQKLYKDNKLVAAICAGPQYLAKAGVLKDRKYTTTLTEEHLKQQGKDDPFPWENFLQQNVVRDNNVITAVGRSFVDFTMEIVDWYGAFDNPQTTVTKENLANQYKGL